jgi:hypothetical protein
MRLVYNETIDADLLPGVVAVHRTITVGWAPPQTVDRRRCHGPLRHITSVPSDMSSNYFIMRMSSFLIISSPKEYTRSCVN